MTATTIEAPQLEDAAHQLTREIEEAFDSSSSIKWMTDMRAQEVPVPVGVVLPTLVRLSELSADCLGLDWTRIEHEIKPTDSSGRKLIARFVLENGLPTGNALVQLASGYDVIGQQL